ncbi:MAG: 3-dehydroquinate synthase [Zetaproteobacteria bacterium CG2_30_46_52]|nr:MAG: 3-dehydroquinate synthase [Zetaproteobacteria bacterium CG2_30_46_52]
MMNSIQKYNVNLGARSYDIQIQAGCLLQIGIKMRELFALSSRCLIVSNDVVAPLYLQQVKASLELQGWSVSDFILPDGEMHKNVEQWTLMMDALMASKLSRNEPIIALGGGVVGDMTGFAASCYRRGIPFVQVPTTVLAQVDSSVGGKTAINHPHGKNMIGAFYQPKLVWIDPLVLNTLDVRQVRAGLAEMIKYGLIRDVSFFEWLQKHMSELLSLDAEVMAEAILRSCAHKAELVIADETEQGQRALLNLGHTFGHAIESITKYTEYLHGEGVALGTIMAARLSEQLGFAPAGTEKRIVAMFELAGLPTTVPQFSADTWLDVMGHDKKNVGSLIRYILLRDVGDAFIAETVTDQDIRRLIQSFEV